MAREETEKEVEKWMEQGENTTYIHYNLRSGSQPLNLVIKAKEPNSKTSDIALSASYVGKSETANEQIIHMTITMENERK